MSWATPYIAQLERGLTVQFRPRGNSMVGKVPSGSLVTVEPIADHKLLKQGDVVLCKVKGKQFLHLIVRIRHGMGEEFLIGNNRGFTNGWTNKKNVYGKCVRVEP
jgi:SOS-response transcriptional repressor LexA